LSSIYSQDYSHQSVELLYFDHVQFEHHHAKIELEDKLYFTKEEYLITDLIITHYWYNFLDS
jgi:hypothetical protein